jgi:hypothetical protein
VTLRSRTSALATAATAAIAVAAAVLLVGAALSCDADRVKGADPNARWSCGTAADLCTCVPVDTRIGAPAVRACAASACCFVDRDGSCTCRTGASAPPCAELMTTFAAKVRVTSCPP